MSSHTKNFGVADLTRVCRCGRKDGDAFVCGISGNLEDLSGITDATQESVHMRCGIYTDFEQQISGLLHTGYKKRASLNFLAEHLCRNFNNSPHNIPSPRLLTGDKAEHQCNALPTTNNRAQLSLQHTTLT